MSLLAVAIGAMPALGGSSRSNDDEYICRRDAIKAVELRNGAPLALSLSPPPPPPPIASVISLESNVLEYIFRRDAIILRDDMDAEDGDATPSAPVLELREEASESNDAACMNRRLSLWSRGGPGMDVALYNTLLESVPVEFRDGEMSFDDRVLSASESKEAECGREKDASLESSGSCEYAPGLCVCVYVCVCVCTW
jgi:hypothetical protein